MELNYKSFGQGDPVIILHGLFGTLDNWQTIARALAEEYLVFIIDQRNHGRSPHVPGMSYPLLAEDLREFMESHWMYRAHIVGHSMGGKTAMQFALSYPDMVNRLAVIDIAPKEYEGGHEVIFDALLSLPLDKIDSRQEAESFLAERINDPGVLQFLLKNLSRNTDGRYAWKMNLPVLHQHYRDILGPVTGDAPFDDPVLFLRGGQSPYIQLPEDEVVIRNLFPQAGVQTVAGAGHWVHAEAPQEVVAHLISFLAG